jgi:hypothetical protein
MNSGTSERFPMLKSVNAEIDMQRLKSTSAHLYKIASQFLDPKTGQPIGGSAHLPLDVADRLEQWLTSENRKDVERMQQEEMRQIQEQGKGIEDRNAAIARLGEWEKRGLLNTEANADAINNFILTSDELQTAKGKFTPETIDVALAFLGPKGRNVLQWASPKSVTPPQPETPTEVLGTCSDGLAELPLRAVPQRHHSVAQLKNLDKRQREARGKTSDGWHGGGSIV